MSTLMSSDMVLNRPSTRLHAPPGGATTISLGGPEEPVRAAAPVATPPAPPAAAAAPAPAAPAPSTVAAAVPVPAGGAGLRVGVVVVDNCNAKASLLDGLQSCGASTIVLDVDDTLQAPFAAQALMVHHSVSSVVVVASGGDPSNGAVSAALLNLGLQKGVPVVTAITLSAASPGVSMQAGAKYAAAAVKLAHMSKGGAVGAGRGGAVAASPAAGPGARRGSGSRGVAAPAKAMPSDVQSLMKSLRESLKSRGATGIAGMARKFRIADDNGDKLIQMEEFAKCMRECQMGWGPPQMQAVFAFFDEGGDGTISYDEFLVGVAGELNDKRAQIVLAAFALMDKDKNGVLNLADVQKAYDPSRHPDVSSGKKGKDEVLQEFLSTFDGNGDGKVTPEEWCLYYRGISASIDDDDYFELMMRNAWHMSGGVGQAANTSCRRVLATHADGTQTVEEIKDDLGISADDEDAMMANLASQGMSDIVGIALFGSVDTATPAAAAAPSPAFARVRQNAGGNSNLVLG